MVKTLVKYGIVKSRSNPAKFIADYNKYKKSRKCRQHLVQNDYISEMQDTCILLNYITWYLVPGTISAG